MSAALALWWQARSARERLLLLLMGVVALPVLLWMAVLRPLGAARAAAEQRLESAVRDGAEVQALAAAIRTAEAKAGGAGAAALMERVRQAVAGAGLAAESLEQEGNGQVTLRIAAARAPVLLQLAATLEAQGMIVQLLSVSRNADATVTARLTLSEAAR